MDEFQVHLMATRLNAIIYCGAAVDFICGGYTSKLQVLDIGVNKPFKGYVRDAHANWIVANPHGKKQGEATGCRSVSLDRFGEGFTSNNFEHLEFGYLHCKWLMTLFYSKIVAWD